MKSILLDSHILSAKQTDYLFCDLQTTMCKTSGGKFIGEGANFLNIGNSDAANLLQGGKRKIEDAIKSSDPRHESVGGMKITAMSSSDGFYYVAEYFSGVSMPGEQKDGRKTNHNDDILTYQTCTPIGRWVPVVATYLPEARVGFIYDHQNSDDAIRIESGSVREFCAFLFDKYGFPFKSVRFDVKDFTKQPNGKYSVGIQMSDELES